MSLYVTLPLLAALLCASAFFSASETALFSLQRETVAAMRESRARRQSLVARLLDRQRDLLATLLFGNMVVNVLFYSATSLLAYHAAQSGRHALAAAFALGGLFAVIIFGEVAPKAAALAFNRTVAQTVSVPLYAVFVVLGPITRAIGPLVRALSSVVLRVVNPSARITREELSMLVETSRSQGHIPPHEGEMIEEVMNLGQTRVRDIMVPRVDVVACSKDTPVDGLLGLFRETSRTKIPVYDGDIDNVVGIAYVKSAALGGHESLSEVTRPAHFVPEAKTAEDLLFDFQKRRITIAVVVDEYGGTSGIVTLADVAGEIVGPIGDEYEAPESLVEEAEPGVYRLAGDLSIRAWEEIFNTSVDNERLSTLGGFVTMLLGRIPRVGDMVVYRNVRFTVEDVKRHRIVSVLAGIVDENGDGRKPA